MSCLDLDDKAILKVIDPMMDDVMRGISIRDYKTHSQHFSLSLKAAIDPERFIEQCDQRQKDWGSATERELVAIFRKPKSFTVIWDQGFDSAPGRVLALVTIALKGGRYFIDYFLLH